jgi:hypothetical protein
MPLENLFNALVLLGKPKRYPNKSRHKHKNQQKLGTKTANLRKAFYISQEFEFIAKDEPKHQQLKRKGGCKKTCGEISIV